MDKSDYVRLLKESFINDVTKFVPVCVERPRTQGSLQKHYHPSLQKERELSLVVERVLPKTGFSNTKGFEACTSLPSPENPQEEVCHASNTISHGNVQLQACKVAKQEAETMVCQ